MLVAKVEERRHERALRAQCVRARYGGGGHPRASGAKVDLPVEEARDTILADLVAAVEAAG